jgi:hypothetical protein
MIENINQAALQHVKDVHGNEACYDSFTTGAKWMLEFIQHFCSCKFAMIRRGDDGKAYCFECKKEIDEEGLLL